jgi:zinc protease
MTDRKRLVSALTLLLTLIWSSPLYLELYAQAPARVAVPEEARTISLDQPAPVGPRLRHGQFANGFRYFITENREPQNRAELRLAVNVGSVMEDDDQRGLAHFLEHMAFNGTSNFEKQELLGFMESIGMRIGPGVNAYTSFDETVYSLQVPTNNPEHLSTAIQILEDWAHLLTLDPMEIDMERGVVIEEWRLGQGAGARLRDKQFPILFRGSRYAERLPIGTVENLQNFDHASLRRFYRDWYRPDLMAVVAVGDFDGQQVEALIRKHFEGLASPQNAQPRPAYEVPQHDGTLFAIATDPEVTSTTVSVYQKLDEDKDWTIGGYRHRIVEALYNNMLNDRFADIARKPDPPFRGASSSKGRLIRPNEVYVLSASVLEGGVTRGLDAVFTEAERVRRFGFTQSELDRQKTAVLRAIERAYANRASRTSGNFAAEYVRAYLEGESTPGIEYEFELYKRFVPEITLEEVNRIGREWIRDDGRVVVISAPDKEAAAIPSETELTATLAAVAGKEITPYTDTVTDQPLISELPSPGRVVSNRTIGDITEWTLSNGIRVVLKPTRFQEDQIAFRGFRPGGTSVVSDDEYVPAATAASLIASGGLGSFNPTDFEKVLTGKIANVTPFISTYEEGVAGGASPADLETMFQLVYLRFTAPRADETIFELWQEETREALANRSANPGAVFSDAYTRIMSQNHPREQPPTLEMLEKADLAESLAFYRNRFADANGFTFVFVGNLDANVMRPLVERYLASLPSADRMHAWRDTGARPPERTIEETVRKGIEPQSQTVITFTGSFPYESQSERTGIQALSMTASTRLRNVMREALGGTYSVNVNAGIDWRPLGAYRLTVSFGSDPQRSAELTRTIFEEIEKLKTEGPTEEEVANTRQALLRSFETNLRQNNFWLNQLVADYARGVEPAASVQTYPASVEAVTPETIRESARKYFNTERYVRVSLLPER